MTEVYFVGCLNNMLGDKPVLIVLIVGIIYVDVVALAPASSLIYLHRSELHTTREAKDSRVKAEKISIVV